MSDPTTPRHLMRVEAVDVIPFALPFREPYITARGRLERREMALVRLRTDDGVEGLGEAVPLSLRGGTTLDQVVRELSESRGKVDGSLSPPAQAAVEMAQLDLQGKFEGVPVWSLL